MAIFGCGISLESGQEFGLSFGSSSASGSPPSDGFGAARFSHFSPFRGAAALPDPNHTGGPLLHLEASCKLLDEAAGTSAGGLLDRDIDCFVC